ncbi:hypothetical protein D3C71_1671640 [compost metagenome]
MACRCMNLDVEALDSLRVRPGIISIRLALDRFKHAVEMIGFINQLRILTPETKPEKQRMLFHYA